ncbi:thiolase family protein [Bordetella sp. BOR01]|uniref:thiolase family protein n=1 Tax=Bordetella sp. BOR01 TaxID=2854779 RepID=UPI002106C680|nr:thiolase family protein [Bordetella sp. BOR01]
MHPLRSKAVVAGIGVTRFGVFDTEDAYTLGAQALRSALEDAGRQACDLDAVITIRIPSYQRFCQLAGADPRTAFALQGQGRMAGVALELGASLIASGAARTVALVYGNDGRSRGATYGGLDDRYGNGDATFWQAYGMTSPGAVHAMMYARHAAQYGTDDDALGVIASTFRRHAGLNPAAVMRKPLTLDDHRNSRYIAEPLRLPDYCLINDGGVALVLTHADAAHDLPQPPVYLRAVATQTRMRDSGFPPDDYWHGAMQDIGKRLYRMADLAPTDMHALMIYDNFTPTVLFSLEGFGYCDPGESGPWVKQGHLSLQGRYPANTSGGHLSESYMQGWALIAEAVRQVRGQAQGRQVADAGNVHYMCASPVSSSAIFSEAP